MSHIPHTPAQLAAERRALELFINVARASRVTMARDLDFTEALIRHERSLQAQLADLPPPATSAEQPTIQRAA